MLRLLAADRTNAQIGAELYISPKTASVHVTSILRKLGVSGRVQVAALIGVPRELGARRPTKSNAPRWPPRQRRLAATGHSLTAACMRRCAGQRRFSRGLAVRGGPGSAALSPGRRMTRFRWSAPWVKDQAAGSADRRGEYAEKFSAHTI